VRLLGGLAVDVALETRREAHDLGVLLQKSWRR
jgi:hypothetical protein